MTGPGLRTLAMLSLGCSGAALQLPLRRQLWRRAPSAISGRFSPNPSLEINNNAFSALAAEAAS
eukprot:CAMPEP_0118878412 /NCGR_PEP_ID=MMETSP1163-20130328/18307_1 /TAXON_ID=124430 /ORGANISM="Phaeomonas parva, Strain CCMP2877" /LENGTH=63 /DNA_ID=CAMNT_0006814233 /DNA_START=366 /DNA_END=553 /DNA_ORIENTATION=-